jgi:hypothetical protein
MGVVQGNHSGTTGPLSQCSLVLVQRRRRRRALRPPRSCLEMPPSSVEQGHATHTKVAPTGQQLDSALFTVTALPVISSVTPPLTPFGPAARARE